MAIHDITESKANQMASLCYEPHKLIAILNETKLVPASSVCAHASVERMNIKVGDSQDGFQSLSFLFKCIDCGISLDPVIAGYTPRKSK